MPSRPGRVKPHMETSLSQGNWVTNFKKRLNNKSTVFRSPLFHVYWNGVLWAVEDQCALSSHTAITWTSANLKTWTLYQKNKGSVEIKQRPIKMESRTIYRTLSSKGTPCQSGIDGWSHLWKVPTRWISHTCPVWLWGYSSFEISSPGPILHGTKWLLWHSHKQSPTFYSKCRINKGLIKGEAK
jgi:hypothetical protein